MELRRVKAMRPYGARRIVRSGANFMADQHSHSTNASRKHTRPKPPVLTWRCEPKEHFAFGTEKRAPRLTLLVLGIVAVLSVALATATPGGADNWRQALLLASIALGVLTIGDALWSARRIQRLSVVRRQGNFYVHVHLNEHEDRPVDGQMSSATKWKTRGQWSPDDKLELPLNNQQAAVLRTLLPRLHDIQKCGDGWFTKGLLRISKVDDSESWRFECVREPIETLSLIIVRAALGVPMFVIVLTLLSVPFLYQAPDAPSIGVTGPIALFFVIVLTFIDYEIVQRWWNVPSDQSMTTQTLDDIMLVKWTAYHGLRCGTHHYQAVLSNAQGFGLFCERLLEMQQTVKAQLVGIDWAVYPQKAAAKAAEAETHKAAPTTQPRDDETEVPKITARTAMESRQTLSATPWTEAA